MSDERRFNTRCDSIAGDLTTPSGATRCMLDQGHLGPHRHINAQRAAEWESATQGDPK